ncbi:MAG: SPOCS domain-containing protein [Oscillospiraceae bacterium]
MDFKLNKETISINEVVFEGNHEQSVELDCILPDYCPDIFRVIKCVTDTKILSQNVADDRVSYEMAVSIRVLYCSEHECAVRCINQKLNYSRTIEFGKPCPNSFVEIIPKVDYINCRVVNKRRLDIRGAVSIKVKVNSLKEQSVVCDAFGMNIQLKKTPLKYTISKVCAEKTAIFNEDTSVPQTKPPILNILKYEPSLNITEVKTVAEKIVAKGDINIKILYNPDKENPLPETLSFSFPFSQIIDIDNLDSTYNNSIIGDVVSCDITVNPDDTNSMKSITCDATIRLKCLSTKDIDTNIVTDAYSISHICDISSSTIKVSMPPTKLNEAFQLKETLEYNDGEISTICDSWASIKNVSYRLDTENKTINMMGIIQYCVLAENSSNMVIIIEKDCGFDYSIPMQTLSENTCIEPIININSCSYTMLSNNEVSVKADVTLNGSMYDNKLVDCVSNITIDETAKKVRDGDYSIKLYYGIQNEDIWDIAKKYSTSAEEIIKENNLESSIIQNDGMILIPISN